VSSDPTPDELEQWLEYWYPLVGLELTEPRAWIRGGLLERPTYAEWAGVERSDVADLRKEPRMREALGMERRNTLPVCLVLVADPRSAPASTEQLALHARWPEATAAAETVLHGLWLHKRGNILPPALFGLYAHDSEGMVSRQPGWYRQELPDEIDDGYVLATEDVAAVERLAELVGRYRARAANPSAELALENLRASYGWHSSPGDRLVALFAGLEAMVGGYHAGDEPFGHVPMPDRAAVAAGEAGSDAEVEAFLAGPGRKLRNAVAHGARLIDDERLAADIEMLRDILRRGLARYLAFCADDSAPSGEREPRSPMIAFNMMLAAAARRRD
jgi:hypothetical protein